MIWVVIRPRYELISVRRSKLFRGAPAESISRAFTVPCRMSCATRKLEETKRRCRYLKEAKQNGRKLQTAVGNDGNLHEATRKHIKLWYGNTKHQEFKRNYRILTRTCCLACGPEEDKRQHSRGYCKEPDFSVTGIQPYLEIDTGLNRVIPIIRKVASPAIV